MTNDEKKQRLGQYNDLLKETDRLYDEINRLQSIAEKVTAVLSKEPRGSDGKERIAVVDDIIEEKHKLEQQIREAFAQRTEIIKAIDTVKKPLHRRVLKWLYLNSAHLDEIAVRENFSYNYIASKVLKEALEMVVFEDVCDH